MGRVWVFNGDGSTLPSAVFSSREKAEAWITQRGLSGVLTGYPVDVPVYDWAIEQGFFTPKRDYQFQAKFIQRFSSASLEHSHYEAGVNRTDSAD
jgi:hypothetical protein